MVTAGRRVAAEQAKEPVGKDGTGRPDLLAVQDVLVALANGATTDGSHVGAGIGLGPALGPHVIAAGHARQKAGLLLWRAKFHDGGAQQQDAVLVHPLRRIRSPVFLFKDQPFGQIAAAAAQILGPHDGAVTGLSQLGFPLAMLLEAFAGVITLEALLGHVVLEPGAYLCAKGFLRRGICQIHVLSPRCALGLRTWRRAFPQRRCASLRNRGSCKPGG